MKRIVTFAGSGGYAVNTPDRITCLNDLVQSRVVDLLPHLQLGVLSDTVYGCRFNPILELPSAHESAMSPFLQHLDVIVPAKSLNRFCTCKASQVIEMGTGEMIGIEFRDELAELALFEAWAEAGYPLFWNADEVVHAVCHA